jgi:hypothetical protein
MPEPTSCGADPAKADQLQKPAVPPDAEIQLRLAAAQVSLRSSKRALWLIRAAGGGCVLVIAYAAFWPALQPVSRQMIATGGGLLGFITLAVYLFQRVFVADREENVAVLMTRQRLLKTLVADRAAAKESMGYFDRLVDINLNSLGDYYLLIKTQANNGFQATLFAAAIGFFLIVAGLAYGFFDRAGSQLATYVGSASGVITEFIAAVFFYLYSRTVRQMKSYHDNLLTVQNILLAFKIVDETRDDAARTAMMKQVFGYLMGKSGAPYMPEADGKTTG